MRPSRGDRERQGDREQRRDHRPDVGDEAQDGRQQAPQDRIRHADEIQPDPDGDAVEQVDHQLHQQVAADPLRGVVHRLGGPGDVAGADQADDPIAQILALEQHEDHEHHHQPGGRDRRDQRSADLAQRLHRRRRRTLDLHEHRLGGSVAPALRLTLALGLALFRGGCFFQFLAEIPQHIGGPLDDAAARYGDAQITDLGTQVPLVARQVRGQIHDLGRRRSTPTPSSAVNTSTTTSRTDGMRPRRQRRRRVTIGASMKLSRSASASGIRISLPRYRAPTTITIPTSSAVGEVVGAAGFLVRACRQAARGGAGVAMAVSDQSVAQTM